MTTVVFTDVLAQIANITWDIDLSFYVSSYKVAGVETAPSTIFVNTSAYSGLTDPWPETAIGPDQHGLVDASFPTAAGDLLALFQDPAGFVMVIESAIGDSSVSVYADSSSSFPDSVEVLKMSALTNIQINRTGASASASLTAAPYQRAAFLCTPTQSIVSVNGSAPLSLTGGSAANFSNVGFRLPAGTKLLKAAAATGITAGHLMILSNC